METLVLYIYIFLILILQKFFAVIFMDEIYEPAVLLL